MNSIGIDRESDFPDMAVVSHDNSLIESSTFFFLFFSFLFFLFFVGGLEVHFFSTMEININGFVVVFINI